MCLCYVQQLNTILGALCNLSIDIRQIVLQANILYEKKNKKSFPVAAFNLRIDTIFSLCRLLYVHNKLAFFGLKKYSGQII